MSKAVLNLPGLYPKQRAVFFNPARLVICQGSTKSGKTVGALAWQVALAHDVRWKGMRFPWVARTEPQARMSFERAERFMQAADPKQRLWASNKTEKRIKWQNGSQWVFCGSEELDALYGYDNGPSVIDEGSRCKEGALDALISTTTATRAPIRVLTNVKGKRDWTWRLAARAKSANDPDLQHHLIVWKDAVEAGVLTVDSVEFARKNMPAHVFDELYNCEPTEDGANPFGMDAIRACIKPKSEKEPVCFGIDLARSIDFTVIVGLDEDAAVCRFERWNKKEIPGDSYWDETEKRLAAIIGDVPALMDVAGIGDVFVERMKRHCPMLDGYNTGSKKQALMEALAVSIQQRRIGIPDNSPDCPLRDELESFEYSLSAIAKKVQYAAPEGSHDDCVVALGLANMAHDGTVNGSGVDVVTVDLISGDDEDRMWTRAW